MVAEQRPVELFEQANVKLVFGVGRPAVDPTSILKSHPRVQMMLVRPTGASIFISKSATLDWAFPMDHPVPTNAIANAIRNAVRPIAASRVMPPTIAQTDACGQ
jgi:hypothetical protein